MSPQTSLESASPVIVQSLPPWDTGLVSRSLADWAWGLYFKPAAPNAIFIGKFELVQRIFSDFFFAK